MMHETVIADKIIKEAMSHGKVKRIELEIGELASVPEDELTECLSRLVKWKIVSKEKPAKVKCSCGFSGHPKVLERGHDYFFIECPKCRKVPEIIDGKDIRILSVVVE